MKQITDIFSKSPFGLLEEHMQKVSECLIEIPTLVEAFVNGNSEVIESLLKTISELEHGADTIKDQIREHLPKSIFMPVSREDLLKLLHRQDNIADCCEDLAFLISVRNTPVIDELKTDIKEFTTASVNCASSVMEVTKNIKELMESTFSGPKAEEVLTLIENVGQMEWKTDQLQHGLIKKMFSFDDKIDPVSQIMLLKIFEAISNLSDTAEDTSNAMRLMISK